MASTTDVNSENGSSTARRRLDRLPALETIDLLVGCLDVPLGNRAVNDVPCRLIHPVVRHIPASGC